MPAREGSGVDWAARVGGGRRRAARRDHNCGNDAQVGEVGRESMTLPPPESGWAAAHLNSDHCP